MDPKTKERGWLSQLIKKLARPSERNVPALILQEIVFDDIFDEEETEDDHQEAQSDHNACSDAG